MSQTIKFTNQQMLNFRATALDILKRNEGKWSKFLYALKKNVDKTEKIYEKYIEESQDINIEHAATDEKGFIIMNEGAYSYKPEGQKALNKKLTDLLRKEVECEGYLYSGDDVPEGVTLRNYDVFSPFLWEPMTEDKLESILKTKG